MERYTLQERIEIIKIHYKNGEQLAETVSKTRTFLGRREAPTTTAIKKLVEKFEVLGQVSRSLELGVPQTSLHRILHKDLGLKAYKVQLTKELKPVDHQQRRVFADWVVEMHENDPEFHRKIILSDESLLHLGGFVNKQNYRIWSSEKPKSYCFKSLSILNV